MTASDLYSRDAEALVVKTLQIGNENSGDSDVAENAAVEKVFHTVLASGIAGICVGLLRPDGTIIYSNNGLSQKLGLTSVTGRDASSLIWPSERRAFIAQIDRHFRQADRIQFETALISNSGERIDVLISALRVDFLGEPASVGVVVDVTKEKRMRRRLHSSFVTMVEAIARTVEARDPYTAGHQNRVAELSMAIAAKVGLSEHMIEGLGLASIVHDIGKISVPAEILSKPGQLSSAELALVKTHAEAGYEILREIDFPWPIAEIVRQHHERMDGSGYPRGLRSENILPEARILGVADTVDSMMSQRPYRPGLGVEAALAEIETNRRKIYDARVVDECIRLFRQERFEFSPPGKFRIFMPEAEVEID